MKYPRQLFPVVVAVATFFSIQVVSAQNQNITIPAQRIEVRDTRLEQGFKSYAIYELQIDQLYSRSAGQENIFLEMTFEDRQNWPMYLVAHDLRSANCREVLITSTGFQVLPKRPNITYRGSIDRPKGGEVRVTISENLFMGYVTIDQVEYFFEPLSGILPGMPKDHFIVYRNQDVIQRSDLQCGAMQIQQYAPREETIEDMVHQQRDHECLEVQLAIASDSMMLDRYVTVQAVNDRIITVTNLMEPLYAVFDLNYIITDMFVASNDPWSGVAAPTTWSSEAFDILDDFLAWAPGNLNTHDVGQFWTARDIMGCGGMGNFGLVGCAEVIGGICTASRYNVCEDYTNNFTTLRVLSAHEIGHLWDGTHGASDPTATPGNPTTIMHPTITTSATTFSTGNTTRINDHIHSRTCLSPCGTACDIAITNVAVVNESCPGANDGTITITATTSAGPITYSITGPETAENGTGVFTGLTPGAYNLLVTDAILFETCTAASLATVVAAVDNTDPLCDANNFLLILNASGVGSITAANIDGGSTDGCGIASVTVAPTMFDCGDVGMNIVTLTVTDINANSSTCTAIVTVVDNTPPQCLAQDITVFLDMMGQASIPQNGVNNASNDACGILSITVNQDDFVCANIPGITITQTVTDVNGNTSTCNAFVTVIDNIPPVIDCPLDIIVTLGPGECRAIVDWPTPDVTDNCEVASIIQTGGPPSGSYFEKETTTEIEYTAEDGVGNTSVCTFTITINPFPNPIPFVVCNNAINVSLDGECNLTLTADMLLEGGPYMCYEDYLLFVESVNGDVNYETISLSPGSYQTTVTNPETGISCWGIVNVEDKLPPQMTCIDVTLNCGESTDPVFIPVIEGSSSASAFPGSQIGPDAGTVTTQNLVINAPAAAQVTDINLTINLTHTWSDDLDVFLVSPNGTQVEIATDVCGANDNWSNVTFDDEALVLVTSACVGGTPTLSGTVRPESFLSDFDGGPASGTWALQITDDAGGDQGILISATITLDYFVALPYAADAVDACGDVILEYADEVIGEDCENQQILRTWTATDESGNVGQCIQTITILPLTLDAVEFPALYEGTCGDLSHPNITGWPTVNGVPIVNGNVCNIFLTWWDHQLPDCGAGTKIVREWTLVDWCSQDVVEGVQIIKLVDDEAPWLECPADHTVGSDPWFCNKDVVLEVPYAEDHCGTPFTLIPSVSAGTLVHFGGTFWRVDNLPVGTHTITWTAEDDCGNSSQCSYELTVVDDVTPVPICDEHTILSLTNDDPLDEGLTKIYATTFDDGSYDNCGPVTFLVRRMESCIDFDWIGPNGEYPNNDGGQPESMDRGLTFQEWVPFACCDVGTIVMVELRVTDLSGNINSCMVEVEIQDKLPPLIVCPPDITVSCDFWFDAHETDGFQPTDGLESVFGRVLDAYDYNESDREYVIVDDPGNTQLPQPYHWGIDGWADDNCDVTIDVRTRLFDDCSGNDLPGGAPDYAVRLVERTFRAQDRQGNTSTCRQRIWVVDFDPFYITDTQCGLNNADDVRWPCDLTLTDCPQGELTPENLSQYAPNNRPIVNDDNCSIIGVTYEDQIFYFVDNACYKIVRTWTVIDWCQFEDDGEGGHYGYWTYVQVIKVHDEEGAEFLDCRVGPLTYCVADPNVALPDNNQVFLGEENPNSSACSVHVWEERTVFETCSDIVIYDVKIYPYNGVEFVQIVEETEVPLDSNGQAVLTWDTRTNSLSSSHPIRRYGLPYNDRFCSNWPLPGGSKEYHRVLWTVEDGCGNLSTCEYLFRLEDCKEPSPVCVGLSSVVMPGTGSVTIWAQDFNASSFDDCTAAEDLLYSFSGASYQPSRDFDCAAIEANGGPSFLVEIWVADEGNDQNCNGFVQPLGIEFSERNKDFCTSFIVIDDNEGVCGDSLTGGVIETEELQAVEKVLVKLTNQNGQVMNSFTTDKDGFYHFINPLLDYSIEPNRNDNHKNGVSTLDLVAIQKHLLGIQLLDSPYKLIAADANNSESVSALDLVDIRKLILGLYTEFPKNESWRFVSSAFEVTDPVQPWPFEEILDVENYTMGHDFIGVKIGDVNGNVVANATQVQTRNIKGVLEFNTAAQTVVAGQTVNVPVSARNFTQILGYQFTMGTAGLSLTSVEAGALDMSAENVGVHTNAITVSWNKVSAISSSDVLFTLNFTATESGELSKMLSITSNAKLTEAEAYNGEEEILDVALTFGTTAVTGKDFALFQNNPNPFEGSTVIGFTLPEAMDATFTVYDVTGKVVRVIEGSYAQGYNEELLKGTDLPASGVFYYQLHAGDFMATKSLVLLKQ